MDRLLVMFVTGLVEQTVLIYAAAMCWLEQYSTEPCRL